MSNYRKWGSQKNRNTFEEGWGNRGGSGHGRKGATKEFGVADGGGEEKEAGMNFLEVGINDRVMVEEDNWILERLNSFR